MALCAETANLIPTHVLTNFTYEYKYRYNEFAYYI